MSPPTKDESKDNSVAADKADRSFSEKWTAALKAVSTPLLQPVLALAHHAATHPKVYIVGTILFSLGVMVLGIATNFTADTDDAIWTPQGARSVEHGSWVEDDSNFPKDTRAAVLILHRDGSNLLGTDGSRSTAATDDSLALESVTRMFEALDVVRATPRYDELCTTYSDYIHPTTGATTCQVVGIPTFWNDSTAVFAEQATSDEAVLAAMSSENYPFGGEVDREQIIGYNAFDATTGILNYGETYVTVVVLPTDGEDIDDSDDPKADSFTLDFEEDLIDRVLALQEQWAADPANTAGFRIEIIADRSFEDEFERAVTNGRFQLDLLLLE